MHDVTKAVVPQQVFDLVWDKEAHEGFAQLRRYRFESAGHLESRVVEHTVRLPNPRDPLTPQACTRISVARPSQLSDSRPGLHGHLPELRTQ
jgi:hypothetical protein